MYKLKEADRDKILAYVGVEPEFNLFFIGDIESFGVDSPEVSVFACGDETHWDCLVLRYKDNYVVYSQDASYDAAAVAGFLQAQDAGMISGKLAIVARLEPFFPERRLRSTTFTKCTEVTAAFPPPPDAEIRAITESEAASVADLIFQIDEFAGTYKSRADLITSLKTGISAGSACWGAFSGGELVATARTSAENSISAMVIGVATHPDRRGRGYASAVVSCLCSDVLRRGRKFLCLFYDNPAAGRIYNKIGFMPFGAYALFK